MYQEKNGKILRFLYKKHWWRTPMFVCFLVSVFLIYLRSKNYIWKDWTGFEGKTIWDWFDLLIIPATLAVVAIVLEAFERKADRANLLDNQRETILQNYFDAMTRLILDKDLKRSHPGDEVREIAEIKTYTSLERLDGNRKGELIKFLGNTKLIQKIEKDNPIISLRLVNLLEADLVGANLEEANLQSAHLERAHLLEANLNGANLENTYMQGATLIRANLINSHLQNAHLIGTYFQDAFLMGAKLTSSLLERANLTGAHLEGAYLENVDLTEATLENTHLKDAHLESACLKNAYLEGAHLQDAYLMGANLVGAHLEGTSLMSADLTGASPMGTHLQGVDLREANLQNATMPDGEKFNSTIHTIEKLTGMYPLK